MNTKEKLFNIWSTHGDDLPSIYRWVNEKERESELYFSILQQIVPENEIKIREITNYISALNLLDTETLARCSTAQGIGNQGEASNSISTTITRILIQNGIEAKKAERCTTAICEAATTIQSKYHGRMQKFLRKYSLQMIKELSESFEFSDTQIDKNLLFALWLQNILEMPILTINKYVTKFIKENRIDSDKLIDIIDDLNINPVMIDDLLRLHFTMNENGSVQD